MMIWLVNLLARALSLLILLRVAASWLDPGGRNPYVRLLNLLTEPILAPFRRIFHAQGMRFDFSPLLALIAIEVIRWLAVAILR